MSNPLWSRMISSSFKEYVTKFVDGSRANQVMDIFWVEQAMEETYNQCVMCHLKESSWYLVLGKKRKRKKKGGRVWFITRVSAGHSCVFSKRRSLSSGLKEQKEGIFSFIQTSVDWTKATQLQQIRSKMELIINLLISIARKLPIYMLIFRLHY